MLVTESEALEAVPLPLLEWILSQRPLPKSIHSSRTLYEATRAARKTGLKDLQLFIAINSWATIALIADERTQGYMEKLITDEAQGINWTVSTGSAVKLAMEEISGLNAKKSTRKFEQSRSAAIKSLNRARKMIAELKLQLPLRELLDEDRLAPFCSHIAELENADNARRTKLAHRNCDRARKNGASIGEVFKIGVLSMGSGPKLELPDFDSMLQAAERRIASLETPVVDRHGARTLYLRAMFVELRYTPVASTRVAFLVHAVKAIFGEDVKKRDVRKAVADLIAKEKRQAEAFANDWEDYIASLDGHPVPESARADFLKDSA